MVLLQGQDVALTGSGASAAMLSANKLNWRDVWCWSAPRGRVFGVLGMPHRDLQQLDWSVVHCPPSALAAGHAFLSS